MSDLESMAIYEPLLANTSSHSGSRSFSLTCAEWTPEYARAILVALFSRAEEM
jgi:hypothetical protein